MSRFERRRGYGSGTLPKQACFFLMRSAQPIVAVFLVLMLSSWIQAQDENVHIQPREKAPPNLSHDSSGAATTNAYVPDRPHTKPFQVDVDLVLVNVTVTDDWNRIVTGLEKENFTITEGDRPQE